MATSYTRTSYVGLTASGRRTRHARRMKCLFVCLLVACDAGAPQPAPTTLDASATRADIRSFWIRPSPMVTTGGHTYAIVQVHDWTSECSNLGACTGRSASTAWRRSTSERRRRPRHLRRELLAGRHRIWIAMPKPGPTMSPRSTWAVHDAAPVRDAGWCLGDMPVYFGTVLAVRYRARSRRCTGAARSETHAWSSRRCSHRSD